MIDLMKVSIITQFMVRWALSFVLAILLFNQPVVAQLDYRFHTAKRFGPTVNSNAEELLPILSPDGRTLYFTRSLHPKNIGGKGGGQDVWYGNLNDDNKWEEARNMGNPINNEYDNAVCHVDAGGLMLYLNNTYVPGTSLLTAGISYAVRFIDKWQAPRPIRIPGLVNNIGYTGYSISDDGTVLFLSASPDALVAQPNLLASADDRVSIVGQNGPLTKEDLYVCFKRDTGGYTAPVNLGQTINTDAEEFAPWYDSQHRTLYFASAGHGGYGGVDIFAAKPLDDKFSKWSKPVNLGPAVNSKGFDAYFRLAPNRKTAIYASDSGITDDTDIYNCQAFNIQDSLLTITNTLRADRDSLKVLLAQNKQQPAVTVQPELVSTGPTPAFVKQLKDRLAALEAENDSLKVKRKLGDRNNLEVLLDQRSDEDRKAYVDLLYATYPTVARQDRVLFDFDKSDLRRNEEPNLVEVLAFLKLNPEANLFITGHTDDVGSLAYNEQLSSKRAATIKAYMELHGINPERIRTIGKGLYFPIASNKTASGRQQNRRTEIEVRMKRTE